MVWWGAEGEVVENQDALLSSILVKISKMKKGNTNSCFLFSFLI